MKNYLSFNLAFNNKEDELQEKSNRLSELNKELDIGNKDEMEGLTLDDEPEHDVSTKNKHCR